MDRLLDQAVEKARLERSDQGEDALFAVCAFAEMKRSSIRPGPAGDQWIHAQTANLPLQHG